MNSPTDFGITETSKGIDISVYVTPRSSANSIAGARGDELKVTLAAPPVEGAANRALLEYLAKRLGIPRNAVRLLSGETSRHKVVSVEGIDRPTAMQKLGLA